MNRSRRRWLGLPADLPLRPPGARAPGEFEALCIRCSRCIEVCPYGSLRPGGWSLGVDAGTPVVRPREIPCYLCMECPPVCPSGALDQLVEKAEAGMGIAEIDTDHCYAFQGILCRTCVDECPLGEAAIYENGELRPVVTDDCVGCGVCERFCPAENAAIRVHVTKNSTA